MRRPSGRCTPNRVTITKATFTKDVAAGRQLVPGAAGPPIACAVQAKSSETTPANGRQQQVTRYEVLVHDDPGVTARDTLTWVDGGGKLLVVTGVRNASGRSRTWAIDCTEVK